MPGLYDLSSNANVTVTNTTGLYQGSGNVAILNSAQQLLTLLDNNGNVNFYLDPATGYRTIYSNFIGIIPPSYGNTDVAAYLPTYTGSLNNSNSIINLNANLGAFETYANATFSTGSSTYGNSNVAAYIPTDPTIIALQSNAASQQTQINTNTNSINVLNANVGAFETYANATFATQTALQTLNANVGAFELYANANAASQQTQINTNTSGLATLNANVGAFETYANTAFLTSSTGYGNANVAAYLTGNITVGNIKSTSGYFWANGVNYSSTVPGTYTNSNVTNLLSGGTYSGDINALTGVVTAAAINSTGQVTAATYLQATNGLYSLGAITEAYSDGIVVDYTSGNGRISVGTADALTFYAGGPGTTPTAVLYPTGNLVLPGRLTMTNGIFWSNGTAYSSGGSTYGNANVAAYLPTYNGQIGSMSNVATTTLSGGNVSINSNYGIGIQADGTSHGGFDPADIYIQQDGGANVNVSGNWITLTSISENGAIYSYGKIILGGVNPGIFWQANGNPYSTSPVSYGNTQVAQYLASNTDPTISNLNANAASQAVSLNTLNANVGAFETYANTAFVTSGFNGNLAGNLLYDSTNYRILANAYPLSSPSQSIIGNYYSNYMDNVPTYVNGALQMPSNTSSPVNAAGTIHGMVLTSNIGLQSAYGVGGNKAISQTLFYTQVTPVTANSMNAADRVRGHSSIVDINLGGKSWGTMSSASADTSLIAGLSGLSQVLSNGNIAKQIGVLGVTYVTPSGGGFANVQYSDAFHGINVFSGSNGTNQQANVAYSRLFSGYIAAQSANLRVQNAVGLHTVSGWAGTIGTATGADRAYALLNEDTSTIISTVGNVIINANTTAHTGFMQLGSYTVATLPAVGLPGQVVSISNPGNTLVNPAGSLAFWDSTNTRWSYVADNTVVA